VAFPELLLASASPRRQNLLREGGFKFAVQPAHIEETTPDYLTVTESVLLNAKRKATHVSTSTPTEGRVILGVDTLVSIDDTILGKPRDRDEAFEMVARLTGRTHNVVSGVWMISPKNRQYGFVESTQVTFRAIQPEEILRYHEIIDPLDKAGAYAAQEDPIGLIASVVGSRTNVIGLPMERLRQVLMEF
jgi:septum formation protein